MKKSTYSIAIAMAGLMGMAAVPSMAKADSLKDKLDKIQLSGFVDTSVSGSNYTTNTNGAKNRGTGLDQVELDLTYNEDRVGMRFDFNVFPSDTTTVTNDSLMEQGYITYTVPGVGDSGLTATMGKFNAPIGWELLDAPDMYQYSHALVFNYGLPTNLTGLMLNGSYGMLDAHVYWTDGMDTNGTQPKGMRTFGGRLGITPFKGLNVGVSYIEDKNKNNTSTTAALTNPAAKIFDVDLTYDGIENLLIGAEYNENKSFQAANQKSRGYMMMAHYDFNDTFGATLRYGNFDFDTAVTGASTAYTGAVTASLGGGLGGLIEVRKDKNTATATDSNGTPANKTVTTYAMEATYAF